MFFGAIAWLLAYKKRLLTDQHFSKLSGGKTRDILLKKAIGKTIKK